MDSEEVVLKQLEKELKKFIRKNPHLKHFALDSFSDHRERYQSDLRLIDKYFKGGKILDIGASPFHLTFCLKQNGLDITGLDIDPDKMKNFIKENNLIIKKCNIETEKLPFKTNTFDLVIFNEVFEHLRLNPITTLKEINRVLKPKGMLILTTPNLYAFHKILMFNCGMGFNNAYNEFNKLNIYGYMGHIREYSTREVTEFLQQTNFKIEKVEYQNHYSFFNYASSRNIFVKLGGFFIDTIMDLIPPWRRHQAFIALKKG